MTPWQKYELEILLEGDDELHHGGCKGADVQAHEIALRKGCVVIIHPSNLRHWQGRCPRSDRVLPPKDPLERNRDIVDSVDAVVAAPATIGEVLRSGTWATIRYARQENKILAILEP